MIKFITQLIIILNLYNINYWVSVDLLNNESILECKINKNNDFIIKSDKYKTKYMNNNHLKGSKFTTYKTICKLLNKYPLKLIISLIVVFNFYYNVDFEPIQKLDNDEIIDIISEIYCEKRNLKNCEIVKNNTIKISFPNEPNISYEIKRIVKYDLFTSIKIQQMLDLETEIKKKFFFYDENISINDLTNYLNAFDSKSFLKQEEINQEHNNDLQQKLLDMLLILNNKPLNELTNLPFFKIQKDIELILKIIKSTDSSIHNNQKEFIEYLQSNSMVILKDYKEIITSENLNNQYLIKKRATILQIISKIDSSVYHSQNRFIDYINNFVEQDWNLLKIIINDNIKNESIKKIILNLMKNIEENILNKSEEEQFELVNKHKKELLSKINTFNYLNITTKEKEIFFQDFYNEYDNNNFLNKNLYWVLTKYNNQENWIFVDLDLQKISWGITIKPQDFSIFLIPELKTYYNEISLL